MDLRTQTSLSPRSCRSRSGAACSAREEAPSPLALRRVRPSIAAWYSTTFVGGVATGSLPSRLNLVCAVAVPLAGAQFFRSFVAGRSPRAHVPDAYGARRRRRDGRRDPHAALRPHRAQGALFLHVTVMLAVSLLVPLDPRRPRDVALRGRAPPVPGARGRARRDVHARRLPSVRRPRHPARRHGAHRSSSCTCSHSRSSDTACSTCTSSPGGSRVLTALSFTLAVIFWVLVEIAGGRFFLHSVVAALVVLLVVRSRSRRRSRRRSVSSSSASATTSRERSSSCARSSRTCSSSSDLARLLMDGLERSRRVTHAAVYLVEEDRRGYTLIANVGPPAVPRLELAPARPLLDRLTRDQVLVLENARARDRGAPRDGRGQRGRDAVSRSCRRSKRLQASVCVADPGRERRHLRARHACVTSACATRSRPKRSSSCAASRTRPPSRSTNSRLYRRHQGARPPRCARRDGRRARARDPQPARRDQGERSVPGETTTPRPKAPTSDEFLDIIVEEVDRLNRVVGSFLDYARPSKGDPAPTDVNAGRAPHHAVSSGPNAEPHPSPSDLALADELPKRARRRRAAPPGAHQLGPNAVQAMETRRRADSICDARSRERAGCLRRCRGRCDRAFA